MQFVLLAISRPDSSKPRAPDALQNVTFNNIPCLSSLPGLDGAPAPSPEAEQLSLAAFYNASQSVSDGLFVQYTPVRQIAHAPGHIFEAYPGSCFRPNDGSLQIQHRVLAETSLAKFSAKPVGACKTQHLLVHNHCDQYTGDLHLSAPVSPLVKDLQRDKLAALAYPQSPCNQASAGTSLKRLPCAG